MKTVRFIILEDEVAVIHKYRNYLIHGGVEHDNIWPDGSQITTLRNARWMNVMHTLAELQQKGWDPTAFMTVLILDLALNEEGNPLLGIEEIRKSVDFLDQYVILVVSNSADAATDKLEDKVDGLLAKRDLTDIDPKEEGPYGSHRFWTSIRSACQSWSRRTGRKSTLPLLPCAPVDSDNISLTVFRARFGMHAIDEIASYISEKFEANQPPHIFISNGGFSGAAVLLIFFSTDKGVREIALKLSESRSALEKEASAAAEAINAAGKFDYAFQSIKGPYRLPLGGRTVYGMHQIYLKGTTLEHSFLDASDNDFKTSLAELNLMLNRISRSGIRDSRRLPASRILGVSEEQVERCCSNAADLHGLHKVFVKHVGHSPLVGEISQGKLEELCTALRNWSDFCDTCFPEGVAAYEQHGDFHARNIMVCPSGGGAQIKFIDSARFGNWPAFYDITRLRLNLAIRMLDPAKSQMEFMPDRVWKWEQAWTSRTSSADRISKPDKYLSRYNTFQDVILKIIANVKREEPQIKDFDLTILLNECFDLIKMIGYVDISPFRRLWLFYRLIDSFQNIKRRRTGRRMKVRQGRFA
ncbi:hypothetical protein KAK06_17240 [Ideonella sp. 4Y11]|uniref:Uncharacterized protein n=1 Tax=Ideonella aquatica TaxID=2824119 RepID=A0A941BL86_9BURK|nr:hypothetical protein [Ideonella aquatica]MBQ0960703.1 hypothetical protein [Ideonella aquatica]